MKKTKSLYHGHRFPASLISCAVCWYFPFDLSLRDIEELVFERGVSVSYESIRRWCDQFARRAKAARSNAGSTWHLDEMFVSLHGVPYVLWRALDEHRAELDVMLQSAATRQRQSASSGGYCARIRCRAGLSPTSCPATLGPDRTSRHSRV